MAEGVGDLENDVEASFEGEGLLHQELTKGDALNELHGDIEPVFGLAKVVHFDDVGVIGEPNDFSLPKEVVDHFGMVGELRQEHFYDARLPRSGVYRQIEQAHAPLRKKGLDLVRAYLFRKCGGWIFVGKRGKRGLFIELLFTLWHNLQSSRLYKNCKGVSTFKKHLEIYINLWDIGIKRQDSLIISFADQETSDIFNGINSKKSRRRLPTLLWEKAQMKLDMLDKAKRLDDLKVPPNNKLEKLEKDLVGKYSIRINDQYRIIFKWEKEKGGASEIQIIDYH